MFNLFLKIGKNSHISIGLSWIDQYSVYVILCLQGLLIFCFSLRTRTSPSDIHSRVIKVVCAGIGSVGLELAVDGCHVCAVACHFTCHSHGA